MATLEQRIEALEQVQKKRTAIDPQFEADIIKAAEYFYAHGARYDLSPPDHFTEGERMALAMVIRADETT